MNDSRKLPPPSPANTAGAISDSEYRELEARLARSKFRSRFRLGDAELRCLAEHPDHVIAGQCRRFLQLPRKRRTVLSGPLSCQSQARR